MARTKKILITEAENQSFSVGIVGEGQLVDALKEELVKRGAVVLVSPTLTTDFSTCTYIFQLDEFEKTEKIVLFCLRKKIRLLTVYFFQAEVRHELNSFFENQKLARLLSIGDTQLWNEKKLVATIIWAMFTQGIDKQTIELSRESPHPTRKEQAWKKTPAVLSTPSIHSLAIQFPAWGKYLFFIILSLTPIFIFLASFGVSLYGISEMIKDVEHGDFTRLEESQKLVRNSSRVSGAILNVTHVITGPFSQALSPIDNTYSLTTDVLSLIESSVQLKKQASVLRGVFFQKETEKNTTILLNLSENIKVFDQRLTETQSHLSMSLLPDSAKAKFAQKIKTGKEYVGLFHSLSPILEKILSKETQTYLLLLQNNTELRPTGGFIGSYGMIKTHYGSLSSFAIHDVYEADGQLKAHVDPPLPIRNYLSQPNWFLRDSNFDPDFALSSAQAEWFLEKETGEKVDGVIGINLFFIQNLLKVLDQIYLPDYKDTITADNLILKATVYSQKGFFPGSTAKRDFLGSLGKTLVFTITDSDKLNYPKLAQSILTSLDQKELMLYFHDQELQSDIEKRGWGGRMANVSCQTAQCYADYFSLIESNLGVNKANIFVTKDIHIKKIISDEGVVSSTVTVVYENKSPTNTFPSGDYRNYLRLYIPVGSTISSITIDGQIPERISQEAYQEDKAEIGFFLVIPAQEKRIVEIRYTASKAFFLTDRIYQFFIQKQAGDNPSLVSLGFQFPSGWDIKPGNFEAIRGASGYEYKTDSRVDRVFVMEFKKPQ